VFSSNGGTSSAPHVNGCCCGPSIPTMPQPVAPPSYGPIPEVPTFSFSAPCNLATTSVPANPSPCETGLQSDGSIVLEYPPPRVGLQNTKHTCYMNSFIQSLFMTNSFVLRIFSFQLILKKDPSPVDREDFEFGQKLVNQLQYQMAKMLLTKHPNTDIWNMLDVFPDFYKKGDQQDVTETVRFVFDKLGGYEQPLIRDVFAGELSVKVMCQVCGAVRSRPETFSDLVLPVPPEEIVAQRRLLPTTQGLLDQWLKPEMLDDDNLLFCERCQQKHRARRWNEIVSPPAHLCLCLNRFSFDMYTGESTKEKTPVQVDGTLQIGPFTYTLYLVIVHTGDKASSGHYYAIGQRAETPDGMNAWVTMDDSMIKAPDMSLLQGHSTEKKNDNPYVLFYRCKQAPPTPPVRIPKSLVDLVERDDRMRTGE